jgi:superfamily II DNA or RNA helicase
MNNFITNSKETITLKERLQELISGSYELKFLVGFFYFSGFEKYTYQLDAVNQALNIIETYNGVIIADVVGLGKSVIASLIANQLGKRGLILCPPGLIGDKKILVGGNIGINSNYTIGILKVQEILKQ